MANEVKDVIYEEEFIVNSRGTKLFTCRWLPANQEPKALVFLLHGYAMECSISMRGTGNRLAKAGFAVHGLDCEGHGKSAGLQGYIPCLDNVVTDCTDHFTRICERKENMNKMRVVLGESMGGAVAILLHRKKPTFWDGAILVAPMCKIADYLKPNAMVINALTKLSTVIPKWKVIPMNSIIDVGFRDPRVRKEIRSNPYCYKGRPRLKTGNELLMASLDLEHRLHEVSFPFLVIHGDDDKVVDSSVSELLYNSASSADKSFKLYPGMWHSLTYGELPGNINVVFSDIIGWLNDRVAAKAVKVERKLKLQSTDGLLKVDSSKESSIVTPKSL